jgi:predicted phage-related endonuclease
MALSAHDLAIRKDAIFSTEAAACLGLSKYSSPVQVWMEKVGQQQTATDDGDDQDDDGDDQETQTEAQAMGLLLQPVIGRLWEVRTGKALVNLDGVTMLSDKFPWIGSHFDFQVRGEKRLVEAKNFHHMRRKEFGEEGSEDVPMDCLVQCLHEGFVYGADIVYLAVLFGGQKFEVFQVPIRQDAVDMLIEKLAGFWKYVEERTPPPPQTSEEVKAMWKRDNGKEVIATSEIEQACRYLEQVKDNLKAAKTDKDRLEVMIKSQIADGSTLRARDGTILATWKAAKDSLKFDKTKFCEENPSLYERYTSMVPGSRRFLLK